MFAATKNRKNLVIGLDNFDSYYSVKLKRDRIENILKNNKFKILKTLKLILLTIII